MKRILPLLLAFICAFWATPSYADYVQTYGGQNPDNDQTNMQTRFERLALGTVLRDLIASNLVSSGAWSNMSLASPSGLNITVGPGSLPGDGLLYQVANLASTKTPQSYPVGYTGNQLPIDSTQIVVPYWLTNTSATIGPLTPPASGLYQYYIIEGTGATSCSGYPNSSQYYACQQSIMFVSTAGTVTFPNINVQVNDTVSFQAKSGATASGTCASATGAPSLPSADSGYTTVGYVCVQHGDTTISCASRCFPYQGTNYNGSTFGSILVGGAAAQAGDFYPSTVTTHGAISECGFFHGGSTPLNVGASGLAVDNPGGANNGNHIIAADYFGDLSVCGSTLILFDQNSNTVVPQIIVNTPVDTGTSRSDTFYPSTGTGTWHLSTNCSGQTYCTPSSGFQICAGLAPSFTPNAAFVTLNNGTGISPTSMTVTTALYPTGGFQLVVYNGLSGTITTPASFTYTYVCL